MSNELVGEVIRQNTRPSKARKDRTPKQSKIQVKTKERLAVKIDWASPPSLVTEQKNPLSILEVKPGVYLLTAEDLIAFAAHFQEQPHFPEAKDPFHDYVQKEIFLPQYGRSEKTLQRHQKDGLLKVYKLGNKLYLKKIQVVAALERGAL